MRQFMRSAILLPGLSLLLLATGPGMIAQQSSSPSLQHRSNSDEGEASPNQDSPKLLGPQLSTLPDDVSGSYNFDHRNESIEVDLDRNNRTGHVELTGYISRLGDDETDTNTPLTFFFDKTSVDGNQISFQTKVVHGLWYSFQGTIFRGRAKTRADEGYYVLHGTLNEHHPQSRDSKSADETVEMRTVNYKSMAQ